MAADGSLNFDTKINTDGFDDGISNLTKVMEKLNGTIEKLSGNIVQQFSGIGTAATNSAGEVDKITVAAKEAEIALKKEKDAWEKASRFTGTINDGTGASRVIDPSYDWEKESNDILAKNRELNASMRQTSETANEEFTRAESAPSQFKNMIDLIKQSFSDIPNIVTYTGDSIRRFFDGGCTSGEMLVDEIDRIRDHLNALEKNGVSFGNSDYDKTYGSLKRAEAALEQYKKKLSGTALAQKKVGSSGKKMNSALKSTKKAVPPLAKSIFKLSSMFRLMMIRMAMRAVIQSAREGFENLAQYSGETNHSMSILMSSITKLKNSFATAFAPALNAAAPALRQMINLLASGATWAGKFLAAITGKDTFVKAVDVQEDYAGSLKDTNKELKENEKETKKATAAFDDLIILQQNENKVNDPGYKPPKPEDMFETVTIESDIKDFAENVKGILRGLFEPLQQSWNEYGPSVTQSVSAMFGSMKNLASDMGASFMQVWNIEGYGKRITDDLLVTFTNLIKTVGNLTDRFDVAWNTANTGTSIIRHMGDIILEVTGLLREASNVIRDWASELDFGPLLVSFDGVMAKLPPIVKTVGGLLLWMLKEILLPIGKWALENAFPAALDFIASAIELLGTVINELKPLATWLWDTFLQPLGKWAGEVIIGAIKKITGALSKLSDWIKDNQSTVETITIAVLAFFAAWKVAELVGKIATMIGCIGSLTSILGDLDLKFIAIVSVVGAVIYLAAQVANAWDKMTPGEKLAIKIIAVAGAIALVVAAVAALSHDYATLAIAAVIAASAGISIAGITADASGRSRASSYRSGNVSPYAAVSYQIPRLATGTVVPPRAGEFAAILGDNRRETEVVSPLSTMKQALKEALAESDVDLGGNRPIHIDMIVDGQRFAHAVYKANNQEKQRVGVRLVTEG